MIFYKALPRQSTAALKFFGSYFYNEIALSSAHQLLSFLVKYLLLKPVEKAGSIYSPLGARERGCHFHNVQQKRVIRIWLCFQNLKNGIDTILCSY